MKMKMMNLQNPNKSSKTMNLCSKCFADVQKKPPEDDCSSTSSSSQSAAFSSESSSASSQSLSLSPPPGSDDPPLAEGREDRTSTSTGLSLTETVQTSLCTPTKRPRESGTSEGEDTPEKRSRTDEDDGEVGGEENPPTAKQKKRRRCYRCQTKLELVQQELGSCRCGYVFCMLHRLPEQHDCPFDHLGRGREDAVLKMVKMDRKLGRSCQRIGEECS
ncbi:AN1-type zinc finger protein 3-like isoform X2 [Gouania willdenowi]|uniref:AN1-type zinc finger protein 3-like isoform X2 n=1 Tax=Gouania willdenowi TaxID=441366 RepID=UPI001055306F|nr:AN1-type zinc finger protein 3-like isoform X2 [Gouania willdenowi]